MNSIRWLVIVHVVSIITLLSNTSSAQKVWIEPENYSFDDSLTIYVDVKRCDMVTLLGETEVYLWTMLPNEAVIGNGPWTDSNPEMRMTNEGDDVWSFKMVPTQFYGVDSTAFLDKGWWISVKIKSPIPTFEPLIRKTEDLALIPAQADNLIPTDSLSSSKLSIITHHQIQFKLLNNQMSVLLDEGGNISIDEALKLYHDGKFTDRDKMTDRTYMKKEFWCTFNATNTSTSDQAYDLSVFAWRNSQIFILDDHGGLEEKHLDMSSRRGFTRTFTLILKAGETKRIFIRQDNRKDQFFMPPQWVAQVNIDRWNEVEEPYKMRFVFMLATLIFISCFYLIWYATNRKKELLYYVLMWSGFLVMLVFPTGPGTYSAMLYITMEYLPIELVWATASSLSVWGILGFSIQYLRLKEFYPAAIKWARYIALAPISMYLVMATYHLFPQLFGEDEAFNVMSYIFFPINTMRGFLVILAFLFAYGMGIFRYRKGFKPAIYFIIAFLPLTLAATVTSLDVLITAILGLPMGIDPNIMLANYISQFIALLLFALAMANREKTLEQEHQQAQQKNTEQIARLREQELNLDKERALQKQLKELDSFKSHFFANISHELRTPLTMIMAQSQRLRKEIQNAQLDPKFNMIDRNSERLLELINQMLDLAKLETGKLTLKRENIELVSFIKGLVYSFDSLAEEKDIDLTFKNNLKVVHAAIDPEKLERIIFNLLSNAIKFTPLGGSVNISIYSTPDEFIMEVVDSGPGISKEDQQHIFDRFYQIESDETDGKMGTGIGLALAYELVQLHGGKIRVKSEINQGSKFMVTLPLVKAEQSEVVIPYQPKLNPISTLEETGKQDGLTSSHNTNCVLVVEDNPDVRALLDEQLKELSYQTLMAENGAEGYRLAQEHQPDLIISDVMMPVMDGIGFSNKIRANTLVSHIPIIMLTAKASEESKIEGLKSGVDAYLTKPFNLTELEVRINKLIEQRQMLREKFSTTIAFNSEEVSAIPADQVFLEKVTTTIKAHISDGSFGLDQLCQEVGMSTTHLNRKLNALIGQSGGKLIRSHRLQYAAEMIRKKAAPVSQIAYSLGFNNPTNFSRSFKKEFGVSPTEYEGK